jgi:selenocysteine-specific elongation factor
VRLSFAPPLPLVAGDRAILRDPGAHRILGGVLVLDVDPPPLRRRGDAERRGEDLKDARGKAKLGREVGRRGAMTRAHAVALGVNVDKGLAKDPDDVMAHGDWLVGTSALESWAAALERSVRVRTEAQPLDPSLSVEAARSAAGIPDAALVPLAVGQAGLELRDGRVWLAGVAGSLGEAEDGLRAIEARLADEPFAAPERPDLAAAGLGPRELAAAERLGRVLRLSDEVVLLSDAPARAMRRLAELPQPFTLSEARQVLGTTRRVAVPLLEHLDGRGWTRRIDDTHRVVVR